MERHIFLSVLIFTIVVLVLAIFVPSGREPTTGNGEVPWNVTIDSEGYSQVFGIAVGRSTVAEVVKRIREPAEVSMFVSPEGTHAVEVYFDRTALGEFSAKVVLSVALDEATMKEMYERGLRISSLGGSVRKVALHPDDLARVNAAPIASLTYLPSANLDAQIIRKRFGEPARVMKERDSGLVHWLYPAIGLDLVMNEKGKEVLLYVKPSEFDQLMAPLGEKAEVIATP